MAYAHKGRRSRTRLGLACAGGLVASVAFLHAPHSSQEAWAEEAAPAQAPQPAPQAVSPSPAQSAEPPLAQAAQPAPVPKPPQQQSQGPQPPALSPACDAPAGVIAANAPLPNLAKALNEHRPLQLLAVGSAATESIGMSSGVKSYPVQIEDMLKLALKGVDVDVINRGTGGEMAQTSAERIRSEVSLTKPDLVLWQLGTNDALARIDPEQFTEIVTTTINWLKANDVDVVLVGLQYTTRFARDENYFAIKHALDQIAKDENILYVKRYDAMKFISQTRAKVHLMASDNYHLSDLGTQCMAEHVARAMIANLFVRRFRPAGNAPAIAPPVTSN